MSYIMLNTFIVPGKVNSKVSGCVSYCARPSIRICLLLGAYERKYDILTIEIESHLPAYNIYYTVQANKKFNELLIRTKNRWAPPKKRHRNFQKQCTLYNILFLFLFSMREKNSHTYKVGHTYSLSEWFCENQSQLRSFLLLLYHVTGSTNQGKIIHTRKDGYHWIFHVSFDTTPNFLPII